MLSFDDPEDELIFALLLPCGTVVVALLAAVTLPIAACLYAAGLLSRACGAMVTCVQQVISLAIPESRGDRIVF